MSNEVLPFVSNEVADMFAQFDDDTLADVLRLWDCDAQEWLDGTTTVFRFERDDLLVWSETGALRARKGAVDTSALHAAELPFFQFAKEKDPCLAWRADNSYAAYLGESALSKTLLEMLA